MADDSLSSEARAWNEYRALRNDPVFRGEGVTRGDGAAVLVLPGLFGNDFYLQPLRSWLSRIGYRPLTSSITINVGCPERIRARVQRAIDRQLRDTRAPLSIVGHSRGGMLGRALAADLGDRCAAFVALGSPVGALLHRGREGLHAMAAGQDSGARQIAADVVVDAGRRAMRVFSPDCEFPACDCRYVEHLLAPLARSTRAYAIYSSEDPVVSPDASPMPGAVNIEVTGSHSGLVVNRAVYRHLSALLAGTL